MQPSLPETAVQCLANAFRYLTKWQDLHMGQPGKASHVLTPLLPSLAPHRRRTIVGLVCRVLRGIYAPGNE